METKKFKPFDKVLTKHGNAWVADIYSNYIEDLRLHMTLRGAFYDSEILPSEGNEHLVGTTDEPETEVRLEKGEWIICFGNMSDFEENDDYCFAKFIRVQESQIYASNKIKWQFAIRFSDFNPNDMEETRKHILCVKNGEIVRYKG